MDGFYMESTWTLIRNIQSQQPRLQASVWPSLELGKQVMGGSHSRTSVSGSMWSGELCWKRLGVLLIWHRGDSWGGTHGQVTGPWVAICEGASKVRWKETVTPQPGSSTFLGVTEVEDSWGREASMETFEYIKPRIKHFHFWKTTVYSFMNWLIRQLQRSVMTICGCIVSSIAMYCTWIRGVPSNWFGT